MNDKFDRIVNDNERLVPELFLLLGELLTEAAAPDEPVRDYIVERLERIVEIGQDLSERQNEHDEPGYIQLKIGNTVFKMNISISVTDDGSKS